MLRVCADSFLEDQKYSGVGALPLVKTFSAFQSEMEWPFANGAFVIRLHTWIQLHDLLHGGLRIAKANLIEKEISEFGVSIDTEGSIICAFVLEQNSMTVSKYPTREMRLCLSINVRTEFVP